MIPAQIIINLIFLAKLIIWKWKLAIKLRELSSSFSVGRAGYNKQTGELANSKYVVLVATFAAAYLLTWVPASQQPVRVDNEPATADSFAWIDCN